MDAPTPRATDNVQATQPSRDAARSVAQSTRPTSMQGDRTVGQPRWRITTADRPSVSSPSAPATRRVPKGTPSLLVDRVLVQTSAGEQLQAVLPHVDAATSGVVLSRGRMKNRANLRRLITGLPDRGLDVPVVFDPEGYRRHIATSDEPFYFDRDGIFAETLEQNLSDQRALGAHVALTPTGLVGTQSVDALEAAAEQASRLSRDDFMFTAPLDARILDDQSLTNRVAAIFSSLKVPVAIMLGGQLDPLGKKSKRRIRAVRTLTAGPAHIAALRTDFNAFDVVCHGGFTAAIGSGGSLRHAIGPEEQPMSLDREDESPSVLYPRLGSWWRGSRIAKEHGRQSAPVCKCRVCDGQRLNRFVSREDSAEARGHAVLVWQEWSRLVFEQEDMTQRALFWKTFCAGRIAEHEYLSDQLKRAQPLKAQPAFTAWAELPAL